LLGPIGYRFRREVRAFAADRGIPILQLKKPDRTRWDDRKLDHVRPYLERAEREGRFGVVAIVACQEFQWVLSGRNRAVHPKAVSFDFFREERRVGIYYFYILDPEFGPAFFEALVADNIGIGRPEQVALVFARQVRTTTREPFGTRVFSSGTEVRIDFRYKHSRVKQYLKGGRALRVETVVNKPADIGVLARLEHLPELIAKARGVNQRLLMIERAGQSCAIGSALFERIHQPHHEGQRTGALRFGDQRAMALAGAL